VNLLHILSYVAVGIVVLVLLAGLYNLMKGGSSNLSQKLMRARIIFQLIAIIIVMTLLYFMQQSADAG
jgi:Hypoxia induced protein conserved region